LARFAGNSVRAATAALESLLALRAFERDHRLVLVGSMNAGMLGGSYDYEVFRTIVLLVLVDVVDLLALANRTADLLLSDPPMDEYVPC
jgi:hypothetical protein